MRNTECIAQMITFSLRSGFNFARRLEEDDDGVWRSGSCLICPSGIKGDGELISNEEDSIESVKIILNIVDEGI